MTWESAPRVQKANHTLGCIKKSRTSRLRDVILLIYSMLVRPDLELGTTEYMSTFICFITLKSCTNLCSWKWGFFAGKVGVLNSDWHSLSNPYFSKVFIKDSNPLRASSLIGYWFTLTGFASSLNFLLSEVTFFALPGFFEAHTRELPHSISHQGYLSQVLSR